MLVKELREPESVGSAASVSEFRRSERFRVASRMVLPMEAERLSMVLPALPTEFEMFPSRLTPLDAVECSLLTVVSVRRTDVSTRRPPGMALGRVSIPVRVRLSEECTSVNAPLPSVFIRETVLLSRFRV